MSEENTALIIPDPTTVTNAPSPAPPELHDIQGEIEIIAYGTWITWILVLLVTCAILYGLWIFFQRRRMHMTADAGIRARRTPPHVRARQRLDEALQHLADPRLFCFLISDAIRDYLEERFKLNAPDRTTEEFLEDMRHSVALNPAQQSRLGEMLSQCDLVKFARHEPLGEELRLLHGVAVQFVGETEPQPEAAPGARATSDAHDTQASGEGREQP